jgi:hypothetical protein
MTPRCLILLAFINLGQWRLLQGKHVCVSTHFVLALTPRSSLTEAEILCCGQWAVQQALTTTAVIGGQDKTLLMWARQEILARHTNQGKKAVLTQGA